MNIYLVHSTASEKSIDMTEMALEKTWSNCLVSNFSLPIPRIFLGRLVQYYSSMPDVPTGNPLSVQTRDRKVLKLFAIDFLVVLGTLYIYFFTCNSAELNESVQTFRNDR